MSRLNKRQLREQQELAALGAASTAPQPAADDKEEEDQRPARAAPAASLFAALGAGNDAQDDEEDEEEAASDADAAEASLRAKKKRKPKKKKKEAKAAASEADNEDAQHTDHVTPSERPTESAQPAAAPKSSKKKKGGAAGSAAKGGAASTAKGVDDMSLEELDAVLASQAHISGSSASGAATSQHGAVSTLELRARSALSVSAPSLDPQIELRKQFGSAAIRAFEAEVRASGTGNTSSARARMQARNPNLKIRSVLVQPKGEWPPITMTKSGMDMEEVDVPGRGRWFTFVHTRSYLETQIRFLEAVHSHDANELYGVFYAHPWHIDTLLQLSDISRHQGDLGQAGDWNARALWAYERAALPPFVASLTSSNGPPQLDFSRKENRGFYLAAHRQVGFLGRRGTWRTALEWTKLMVGLDVLDPHAMLLWLDFLALKAGEEAWLVDVLDKLDAARSKIEYDVGRRCGPASSPLDEKPRAKGEQGGALDWCVGLAYSRALARRLLEERFKSKDHSGSDAALREAIARHPEVVQPLADKIGASLPGPIASHPYFASIKRHTSETDSLPHLLAAIYAHRTESLWKDAERSSWLISTVQAVYSTLKDKDAFKARIAPSADTETRDSVYRHVLASDLTDGMRQAFLGLMPPAITAESVDACDPLPPIGADGQRGNHDYFAPLYRSSQRGGPGGGGGGAGGVGGAGLPDGAEAAHGERVYEAMMAAHAEHPEELRAIMRQMEELQPQIRNLNAGNGGGGRGVINQFGNLLDQLLALGRGRGGGAGGEDDDEEVEDEDEEGEWEEDGDGEEDGQPAGGAPHVPGGWT